MCGLKVDELMGGFRKLHKEELRDLCPSLIIIRMIKSTRMSWAVHAERMGRKGSKYAAIL
jgi:hypothetical protein